MNLKVLTGYETHLCVGRRWKLEMADAMMTLTFAKVTGKTWTPGSCSWQVTLMCHALI